MIKWFIYNRQTKHACAAVYINLTAFSLVKLCWKCHISVAGLTYQDWCHVTLMETNTLNVQILTMQWKAALLTEMLYIITISCNFNFEMPGIIKAFYYLLHSCLGTSVPEVSPVAFNFPRQAPCIHPQLRLEFTTLQPGALFLLLLWINCCCWVHFWTDIINLKEQMTNFRYK